MKRKLTKKQRLVRNLILLILMAGLMDFLIADAFLIPENQFRREERGNMVGPSEILGKEEIDLGPFQGMILGETGDGIILWLYGEDIGRTQFIYRDKYIENMVVAPPGPGGFVFLTEELHLPIVLFDSVPKAARAEIAFTLEEMYDEKDFKKDYLLEAQRSAQGYFLFTLNAEGQWPGLGGEGIALTTLANISSNLDTYVHRSIPVEIRFYDITGALIETDLVTLRSGASIYLEESGVTP